MAGVEVRRRSTTVLAMILLVTAALAACGDPPEQPAEAATPAPSAPSAAPSPGPSAPDPAAAAAARAAELAGRLSDADLVGQVLMAYAYGDSATDVSPASAAGNRRMAGVATPAQMVARYRLGGLILTGFAADDPTGANQPTTNTDSPRQVRALTAGLQSAAGKLPAGVPLLIGTDQEYGLVTRVKQGV